MKQLKIYINGVEVQKIKNFSVQYRIVPELSSCTITLLDEGGLYVVANRKGWHNIEESKMLSDLRARKVDKKVKVDFNVPVFKDSDIVHVFEKRDGKWWWVFHGYVTGVEYGISMDGAEIVSLGCESGLKSLRYNHTMVNSLNIPPEFSEAGVKERIGEYIGPFRGIPLVDKPYYEQIQMLFQGRVGKSGDGEQERIGRMFFGGEGNFKVELKHIHDKNAMKSWMHDVYNKSRVDVANETELDSFVNDERNYDPQNKVVYVILIKTGKYLKGLQETRFVGQFSVTVPVLAPKLSILQDIIAPINFVAYTIPCGDVVIEPLLYGEVDSGIPEPYILDSDVMAIRYSFSGSHLATVAFTSWEPRMPVQTNIKELTFSVVLDADAVRNFGFRIINAEERRMNMRTEGMARMYGEFLLGQSWSAAKTAVIQCGWKYKGGLNRPVYVQKLDGWFLITSYNIVWEVTGAVDVTYNLGYAMLWDGRQFGVDIKYVLSNLDFLFNIYDMFEQEVVDERLEARGIRFGETVIQQRENLSREFKLVSPIKLDPETLLR